MNNKMPEISPIKKILFTLTFFALCIAFLIAFELLLRLFHYGIDTHIFIQPKYISDVYIDNPTFIDKYYSNDRFEHVEEYIKNIFHVSKPKDVLRGIIIGGSTAEGYPFRSNQSFGKIAEVALNTAQSNVQFEIVNLGFTAMSSYYVKDVIPKALNYQPDFIIIYSGHNEYYGTISQSTGGNDLIKNLYISLKEFKTFQLLYNLFNRSPNKNDEFITMMASQFNNTHFIKNEATDREVADHFIQNIDAAIQACSKKNIPVILFEPVCNLIDMPPFSGENDRSLTQLIQDYNQVIKNRDIAEIERFRAQTNLNTTYSNNANIIYLNAKADMIINNKMDLNPFISAKDLDSTPFRARSVLVEGLQKYCLSHAEIYPIFYIPTFDVLASNLGLDIFSNKLFIDHLHFNQYGQQVIGSVLAQQIADLFHFNPEQKRKVQTFFQNSKNVDQAVYLNPFNDLWVYLSIEALSNQPPYSLMIIPYKIPDYQKMLIHNEIIQNEAFTNYIESDNGYSEVEFFDFIINHYLTNNQPGQAYVYLYSSYFQSPGSYKSSYDMARFLSMLQNPPEDPLDYFLRAYLLSNKDAKIYNSMQTYVLENNRQNDFNGINLKYGKPED